MQPCERERTVVVARAKKKNKKENSQTKKTRKAKRERKTNNPNFFLSSPPPPPGPRPSLPTRNVTVAVLFHRCCLCTNRKPNPPRWYPSMDSTTPVCSPPPPQQQQQLLVAGSLLLPGGSQYMARSDATTNKRSDREHLLELEHKLLEARQRVGCCCHKSCRLFR